MFLNLSWFTGMFKTFDASIKIPGVTDWGLASVSAGGVAAVSKEFLNSISVFYVPI